VPEKARQTGIWEDIGVHCSQTERRADEASRDVETWLKCFYMQDRIGENYVGSITAVTSFGIFVTLDDLFVEGLVHISELGKDYFHHDEARHELVGERTGQRYRLSDRVSVQLVRVDLESRKIDFRLLEGVERATMRTGKTERDHARVTPVEQAPAAQKPERQHAKPKRLLEAPVVKEAARPERKAAAPKTQPVVIDDDDDVVSWRKLAGLPDRKGPLAIAADALPARGPRSGASTKGKASTSAQPKSHSSGKAKSVAGTSTSKQKPKTAPKAKPKTKPAARKPAAPKGARRG
jgi:ribonuclease R